MCGKREAALKKKQLNENMRSRRLYGCYYFPQTIKNPCQKLHSRKQTEREKTSVEFFFVEVKCTYFCVVQTYVEFCCASKESNHHWMAMALFWRNLRNVYDCSTAVVNCDTKGEENFPGEIEVCV